jgi:hypothetical protein
MVAPASTNCHVQGGNALVDIIHLKCTSEGVLFARAMAFVDFSIQDGTKPGTRSHISYGHLLKLSCRKATVKALMETAAGPDEITGSLLRQILHPEPFFSAANGR